MNQKKYPSAKEVNKTEHINMVKEIFSTITARYDFLNHLLSMRRDITWRRFAAKKMHFFNTQRFLDVACGTADLALMAAVRYPAVRVAGIDFVNEMLKAGIRKVYKNGFADRIQLIKGDALAIPFRDNSFDVAAIAFGIRNIPDRMEALREMVRVVAPGGQVMVLEMTFSNRLLFRRIYRTYLGRIIPTLATKFSKNPGAYYYLADSIMNFPLPHELNTMMEKAGLCKVRHYRLTFGITYLHEGLKPLSHNLIQPLDGQD